jgi:ElaB/YqjD/DUF883 family membrane-anchored ribosome-binding protein
VDHESPELIERQMEQTRQSLSEKVSELEQQVVGTIQSATEAVNDSVQSARSAVQDTFEAVSGAVKDSVESVSDGVKNALDISQRVRDHPWIMFGGAFAVGFIAGRLVFRRHQSVETNPALAPTPSFQSIPMSALAASSRPAWLSEIFDLVGLEVKKLAGRVITRAVSSIQQGVEEGIPKLIHRAMPDVGPANVPRANGVSPFAAMPH